jgi:hypothetical protein
MEIEGNLIAFLLQRFFQHDCLGDCSSATVISDLQAAALVQVKPMCPMSMTDRHLVLCRGLHQHFAPDSSITMLFAMVRW